MNRSFAKKRNRRRSSATGSPIAASKPLPAFYPGDTLGWLAVNASFVTVSIRSRLFSREIPPTEAPSDQEDPVSIRSRLFSREIHHQSLYFFRLSKFQSAPGFLAGRYPVVSGALSAFGVFQSAPGFLAGRYLLMSCGVSSAVLFQSAPGFLAGRYEYPRRRRE